LKGFYTHLVVYGVVIGFLVIVNLLTYRHYLWFIWAAGVGESVCCFTDFACLTGFRS